MISINKKVGIIDITVDKRTELLGIIEVIGDYQLKYPNLLQVYGNKDYINKIIKEFSKYKNHNVIKEFDYFVKKYGFSYDAPVALFLQLDDCYKCSKLNEYVFNRRLNKDKKIYDFINQLENFAIEINFEEYYESNKELYLNYISNIINTIKKYDVPSFIKDYYGTPIEDLMFIVNMMPFQSKANYGVNLENRKYCNIGVTKEGFEEEKNLSAINSFYFSELLLHEFGHSLVNPITYELKLINEKDKIFDKVKDEMSKLAYGHNDTILNEYIVRAVGLRYTNKFYPEELVGYRLYHIKKGFIYIDSITTSLKEYENNREKYKSFRDFYPVIVENLRKHIKEKGDIIV